MKPKWTYEKLKQWEAQWALKCFERERQEKGTANTPDHWIELARLEAAVYKNNNNNPNGKNN